MSPLPGVRNKSLRRLIELVVLALALTAILSIVISTTINQRIAGTYDEYVEQSLPVLETLNQIELKTQHINDTLSTLPLIENIPALSTASEDLVATLADITKLEARLRPRLTDSTTPGLLDERVRLLQGLHEDILAEQETLREQIETRVRLQSTQATLLRLTETLLLDIDLNLTELRARASNQDTAIDDLRSIDSILKRVPMLLAQSLASDSDIRVAAYQREIDLIIRDSTTVLQRLQDPQLRASLSSLLQQLYRESQPGRGFFPSKSRYLRLQQDLRRSALGLIERLSAFSVTNRNLSEQIRDQQAVVLETLSGNVRLGVTGAMILSAIVLGIVSLVYFYVMPRFLIRPLQQVANAIAGLSRADAQYRPPATHIEELAQIEEALEVFTRYRKALSEREKALHDANLALDESTRKQQLFIRVASHDLRSPMRGIKNLSEVLREELQENDIDTALELVARIEDRSQGMMRLLDDLLDYLAMDDTEGSAETLPLRSTIESHIELLSNPVGSHIEFDCPDTPVCLHWAPLLTVLRNLVDNAIKHHDKDLAHIRLRVSVERDSWLLVEIEDDGPGIAPEFHERVFRAFETLRPKEQTLSSGLGLAVILRFVENNGGSISLESPLQAGRGCRFSLSWPLVNFDGISEEVQKMIANSRPRP